MEEDLVDIKRGMVSVIVPAYNSAISLGRCLDSVFLQEYGDFEVIVINDGSTDATEDVIARYRDRITNITQKNKGQGAARNRGLAVARGEYVAFLDADDFWLPGFLEKCVAFLAENKEAVAVSTGQLIRLWNKEDTISPPALSKALESGTLGTMILIDFFGFWAEQDHIRTGSNIIRRSVIEEAGYQRDDLRISQDLEYWGYIATFGRWGFIPEVLWISDPMPQAAVHGWMKRYRRRRKLCPEVESWHKRIIPRLGERDWSGFRVVRGRVAIGYVHTKIISGDFASARNIAVKYGGDFECSTIERLIKAGVRTGAVGWILCCQVIRMREWLKAVLISLGLGHRRDKNGFVSAESIEINPKGRIVLRSK
jgi:glycosyltransferase involved in cell wall biosynthesis